LIELDGHDHIGALAATDLIAPALSAALARAPWEGKRPQPGRPADRYLRQGVTQQVTAIAGDTDVSV
jgi:hypothetical protein